MNITSSVVTYFWGKFYMNFDNSNFNFFNGCSFYFDPCVGGTAAVGFFLKMW